MVGEDVRYWFDQAAALPACERVVFLESRCADEDVRAEVLSLLSYDATGSHSVLYGSVAAAIHNAAESVLDGPSPAAPVARVGAFEVGELLGSGGMGFVYEGRRVNGGVRQRAAIKFVQVPPGAGPAVRAAAHRRFDRERQMLASLRHPYITCLIDAGTTSSGVPYAVIEQVDGIPIDTYCDVHLADRTDRIRLFLKLCDAVQFAHRNLIVHSDIKPKNVLVTPEGLPKLIDFGIAADLGAESAVTSWRAFTPGYASPEQVRGAIPTIATDVYGLGSVLYRLLTGTPVRRVQTAARGEVIRQISEDDIIRPSAIKPELRGDLENILLKALQREPQARYGSVPEFAEDINRFLARQPVRATPDSLLYRFSRFVHRNWASVSATAALVALFATIAVVASVERRQADGQAAESRRLAERLLFEVHDEIGGLVGATKAREKLGALAVQYLEGIERDYRRDPELMWELVNAYSRLAQSRGGGVASTGDIGSGLHFAEKTLALGALVERTPPTLDRMDKLFKIYEGLSGVFEDAGRPKLQSEAVDRMVRIAPQLGPLREAQALKVLGRYFDDSLSDREAVTAFEHATAILRTLSKHPSKPAGTETQLISTLAGLGRVQAMVGDFSGAAETLQEAIRRAERKAASAPQIAQYARQLYWSHISLGDVFGSPFRFNLGRPDLGAAHYEAACMIAERLVGADPANDVAKLDLARVLYRQAWAIAPAQPRRALMLLDRLRATIAQVTAKNPAALDAQLTFLTGSVGPLVKTGDFEQARRHVSDARRLHEHMRQSGMRVDEKAILRADAIRMYAIGRPREALALAERQLALLPENDSAVLNANFETVEVLERIRMYAAGLDDHVCASATERLVRIWDGLRSAYPDSPFVLKQSECAHGFRNRFHAT